MKKEVINDFVGFVYYHAKNNVVLEDIYSQLKLVTLDIEGNSNDIGLYDPYWQFSF